MCEFFFFFLHVSSKNVSFLVIQFSLFLFFTPSFSLSLFISTRSAAQHSCMGMPLDAAKIFFNSPSRSDASSIYICNVCVRGNLHKFCFVGSYSEMPLSLNCTLLSRTLTIISDLFMILQFRQQSTFNRFTHTRNENFIFNFFFHFPCVYYNFDVRKKKKFDEKIEILS